MKNLMIIFIMIACTFVMAQPKWVSLDGNNTPQAMSIKVLSEDANQIKVQIDVYGYFEQTIQIHGQNYLTVRIPNTAMIMQKGKPCLPKFADLIQIPEKVKVTLSDVQKEVVKMAISHPIAPSKGHLTRDINPQDVDFTFSDHYNKNEFFPTESALFNLGKPFYFAETRGVRVQAYPISVNNFKKEIKVIKSAVLTIKYEKINTAMATKEKGKHHKSFKKMFKHAFLNYKEDTRENNTVTVASSGVPNETNKKLVVIVPTDFQDAIQDWVTWKKKCGYTVTTKVTTSSDTADTIKSYLQGLYDKASTRFGFVVLIGDANRNSKTAQPMPTFQGKKEGAASDRVYVRLSGNDNYPDAFISRISATTATNVKAQLAKIIKYEQTNAGTWAAKGTCIASDEGYNPIDYERTEWLQNGGSQNQKVSVIKGGLMGAGYTYFDDIYDPSASASQVTRAVNEGRGIMCYIGHGSNTSWVTSNFSTSHVAQLNNGGMLPVIWSVACVNGNFANVSECFAEAWLRKTNGGAAAMEASSTNEQWIPPCDKQAATINAVISGKYATFGALECEGVIAGLTHWGDSDSSSGNMMAEQVNLFGDCTMIVKTAKSRNILVNPILTRNSTRFIITTDTREAVEATVTVYTEDLSYIVTAETDDYGQVNLDLSKAPKDKKLYYTIVGLNIDTIVDQEL
ncbi:MAG TPA: C25 family cysteine peptidase [Planctomycetota bacterium]|nr:C25 family cysteine peptidase [Planctomycetota bacterium]HRU52082.1 C25 family cysteine peptidase [Planctomycetota bacterium]